MTRRVSASRPASRALAVSVSAESLPWQRASSSSATRPRLASTPGLVNTSSVSSTVYGPLTISLARASRGPGCTAYLASPGISTLQRRTLLAARHSLSSLSTTSSAPSPGTLLTTATRSTAAGRRFFSAARPSLYATRHRLQRGTRSSRTAWPSPSASSISQAPATPAARSPQ